MTETMAQRGFAFILANEEVEWSQKRRGLFYFKVFLLLGFFFLKSYKTKTRLAGSAFI
jgi:hypothetical protein